MKHMDNKDIKCMWKFEVKCGGEVKYRVLFDDPIPSFQCPVCDVHYTRHQTVVKLACDLDIEIEEVLRMSEEQRLAKIKELEND
jgi:hypothetical protein